jgi:hypothetical protein
VFAAGDLPTALTSLSLNNTSIRRVDFPSARAGSPPVLPALQVLDLRAQRLQALPQLCGTAPVLRVLRLGAPDWGEEPLDTQAREMQQARGEAMGEEGRAAHARKPFDISDWGRARRPFPATLETVEIRNADLTMTNLPHMARVPRQTAAAVAGEVARLMAATTAPGLRRLILVNASTQSEVAAALLGEGGAALRAAYTPRGGDAAANSRVHVVGDLVAPGVPNRARQIPGALLGALFSAHASWRARWAHPVQPPPPPSRPLGQPREEVLLRGPAPPADCLIQ